MYRLLCVFLLFLLAGLAPSRPSFAAEPAYLHVSGEAVLQVPADQAEFRVGVQTDGVTAEQALENNSKAMRQVEQKLLLAGLEKGEYSTARFQLQPRWSPRPRDAEPDWRPRIVGFSVSNSFAVRTTKLEILGKLIEAASAAGANDIGQISFSLADPRAHRRSAIEQATKNAIADAKTLAASAGVRLLEIADITLDHAALPPVRPMSEGVMRTMAVAAAPPIAAPDDLEVRASVSIRYLVGE